MSNVNAVPIMYWFYDFLKEALPQNLVLAPGASIRINTVVTLQNVALTLFYVLFSEDGDAVVVKARIVRNVDGLDLTMYHRVVDLFNDYFKNKETAQAAS